METLLTAFDIFPSAKGAAAHIAQNLLSIRGFKGEVALACLGSMDMPRAQMEDGITILRCRMLHPNFLKRTEIFGEFISRILDKSGGGLTHIHFRDIWSGLPAIHNRNAKRAVKIFEVNGLPSVELISRYPALGRNASLLARLRGMEDILLSNSDRIITVSRVNADYLVSRGADSRKITIIPNTTDINFPDIPRRPPANGEKMILYSGCLAPWQGTQTLLKAFALIAHREDVSLTIAVSNRKFLKPHLKLAKRLGLENRLEIKMALPKEEMARLYSSAVFTVAPLARCERNESQGACPVKIVESMAMGVPVVASDMAITREIIKNGVSGCLVKPDSPRALAVAMTALLDNPAQEKAMGQKARERFEADFSQSIFAERLRKVYMEN